jgi:hypothetical protein
MDKDIKDNIKVRDIDETEPLEIADMVSINDKVEGCTKAKEAITNIGYQGKDHLVTEDINNTAGIFLVSKTDLTNLSSPT